VNLDLTTIQLPVTALTSILHRVSGVAVFVGLALIIYLFDQASASEESFLAIKECSNNSFLTRLALWAVVSALLFHTVMGVKHLIADLGFGETIESGKRASTIALAVAVVLILLAGVWIW
jgi:succinate dehydrogenase / fumarate reductase cytochrome b subunit